MENSVANIELQEKDLELVISEKTLGSLTTNALSIKELITKALPKYDIVNYNETNIADAKKDKAMLNNTSKALNARRIEIEKEFLKPFAEFKEIVGDTVKLISDCSSKIDTVVKESEQKARDQKRKQIEEIWVSKDFILVPISKIFDDKWLNKTSKIKDIQSEIDGKISKIKDDIVTLEAIGEDVDLLKSLYLDTLNINNTIQYANTLKANREKARVDAEERLKQNQEKIQIEADSKPQTPEVNPFDKTEPIKQVEQNTVANSIPELLTRAMKVWGNREQIIALGNFMNENGIRFEKIEVC